MGQQAGVLNDRLLTNDGTEINIEILIKVWIGVPNLDSIVLSDKSEKWIIKKACSK